jgi:hypothetical protein
MHASHPVCLLIGNRPQVTLENFNPENARMIWIVFGTIWLIVLLTLLYSWIERRAYDFRQEVSLASSSDIACMQAVPSLSTV